jgi:uncharacterized membrane protein YbhN (UPF0104 family)
MGAAGAGRAARRGWRGAGRIAAAVALLAGVGYWVGPQQLRTQLAGVAPGWFAAAVAIAIAANAVSAWRWSRLARAFDLRAPFAPLASAYAQGVTVNALLPGATLGGDALRALKLARLGNPAAASALTVLADRASGLWVLCVLSLAAIALALAYGGAPPAGVDARAFWLYAAGLAAAASAPWWPWGWVQRQRRFRGLAALAARIGPSLALTATRRAALVRSLPLSLAVQVLSATALWLCAVAAGGTVGYAAVLAIAAPVFVAAALPISVGGFGPREFAAAVAFPLVGAPPALGAATAVLYGLTAVVQGVLAAPLLALDAGRDDRGAN